MIARPRLALAVPWRPRLALAVPWRPRLALAVPWRPRLALAVPWRPALLAAWLVVLPALLALGPAPAARADGDPASDVLLGASVFYPYSPPVSATLQRQLDSLTSQAAKQGFPVKVALISSPVDLGVIPDLFNKPASYAKFLDQEISFQRLEPLLVVMPAGYGLAGLPAPARSAAASLPRPSGSTGDDLAAAALTAVGKLAAAAGHPLARAPAASGDSGSSTGSGGSGGSGTLIAVLAVLAVLVAVAFAFVTLRGRSRGPR